MIDNHVQQIEELVGDGLQRLGRHIEHDAASEQFPAQAADKIGDVRHNRRGAILNQGELGSCTGNAIAGLLLTEPQYNAGLRLVEPDAVHLYSLATQLDGYPGDYPPDDTGSSGLAAAKAAKQLGYVQVYRHAFGLQHALGTLTLRPVITGVNWYDSFDQPDSNGVISLPPNAGVRGGHEFVVRMLDVEGQRVGCDNSWGLGWGVDIDGMGGGQFWMPFGVWDRLLHESGDVTTAH